MKERKEKYEAIRRLLEEGKTVREICRELRVSPKTVCRVRKRWVQERAERRLGVLRDDIGDVEAEGAGGEAYPFRERYITKMSYPLLLAIQIQRVFDAVEGGGSGLEELDNLRAVLLPRWRKEIDEQTREERKRMKRGLRMLERLRLRMGTWTYREVRRQIVLGYVREYVHRLIGKLDEEGLLLVRDYLMRGGGLVIE